MPKHPFMLDRVYLVTGGSGFIGRRLVEALLELGATVRVLDNREIDSYDSRLDYFFHGDIRNEGAVMEAVEGVDTVFHCAAATGPYCSRKVLRHTNVEGTWNLIKACRAHGVTQLIYLSSASVVVSGKDIRNGDEESLDYPNHFLDAYSASKAEAERLVLSANGSPTGPQARWSQSPGDERARRGSDVGDDSGLGEQGSRLWTCSLRPHAVFGPRDPHFLAKLLERARTGDITHMVGDGRNVVDFTFVDNVVHAQLLAASRLVKGSPACGQAFFITNGEPRSFWRFINAFLRAMGFVGPTKHISFTVAYTFAWAMEILRSILGSWYHRWFQMPVTRHSVVSMALHHWFSHDRATRLLGYKPLVSLNEGLAATVLYFRKQEMQMRLRQQLQLLSSTRPPTASATGEDSHFGGAAGHSGHRQHQQRFRGSARLGSRRYRDDRDRTSNKSPEADDRRGSRTLAVGGVFNSNSSAPQPNRPGGSGGAGLRTSPSKLMLMLMMNNSHTPPPPPLGSLDTAPEPEAAEDSMRLPHHHRLPPPILDLPDSFSPHPHPQQQFSSAASPSVPRPTSSRRRLAFPFSSGSDLPLPPAILGYHWRTWRHAPNLSDSEQTDLDPVDSARFSGLGGRAASAAGPEEDGDDVDEEDAGRARVHYLRTMRSAGLREGPSAEESGEDSETDNIYDDEAHLYAPERYLQQDPTSSKLGRRRASGSASHDLLSEPELATMRRERRVLGGNLRSLHGGSTRQIRRLLDDEEEESE